MTIDGRIKRQLLKHEVTRGTNLRALIDGDRQKYSRLVEYAVIKFINGKLISDCEIRTIHGSRSKRCEDRGLDGYLDQYCQALDVNPGAIQVKLRRPDGIIGLSEIRDAIRQTQSDGKYTMVTILVNREWLEYHGSPRNSIDVEYRAYDIDQIIRDVITPLIPLCLTTADVTSDNPDEIAGALFRRVYPDKLPMGTTVFQGFPNSGGEKAAISLASRCYHNVILIYYYTETNQLLHDLIHTQSTKTLFTIQSYKQLDGMTYDTVKRHDAVFAFDWHRCDKAGEVFKRLVSDRPTLLYSNYHVPGRESYISMRDCIAQGAAVPICLNVTMDNHLDETRHKSFLITVLDTLVYKFNENNRRPMTVVFRTFNTDHMDELMVSIYDHLKSSMSRYTVQIASTNMDFDNSVRDGLTVIICHQAIARSDVLIDALVIITSEGRLPGANRLSEMCINSSRTQKKFGSCVPMDIYCDFHGNSESTAMFMGDFFRSHGLDLEMTRYDETSDVFVPMLYTPRDGIIRPSRDNTISRRPLFSAEMTDHVLNICGHLFDDQTIHDNVRQMIADRAMHNEPLSAMDIRMISYCTKTSADFSDLIRPMPFTLGVLSGVNPKILVLFFNTVHERVRSGQFCKISDIPGDVRTLISKDKIANHHWLAAECIHSINTRSVPSTKSLEALYALQPAHEFRKTLDNLTRDIIPRQYSENEPDESTESIFEVKSLGKTIASPPTLWSTDLCIVHSTSDHHDNHYIDISVRGCNGHERLRKVDEKLRNIWTTKGFDEHNFCALSDVDILRLKLTNRTLFWRIGATKCLSIAGREDMNLIIRKGARCAVDFTESIVWKNGRITIAEYCIECTNVYIMPDDNPVDFITKLSTNSQLSLTAPTHDSLVTQAKELIKCNTIHTLLRKFGLDWFTQQDLLILKRIVEKRFDILDEPSAKRQRYF